MRNSDTNERQDSGNIPFSTWVTAFGMALTVALPHAAQAQVATPPPVPAGIEVTGPNEVFRLGRGVGTQNYVCQPSPTVGQVAWTLFTPQATLFNDQGEQLTTHFLAPNPDEGGVVTRVAWEDSQDTSTVWGKAVAAATVSPDAIAWLRIEVVGRRLGPTGGDTLFGTTFIQRLNTVGGLAPSTGCDLPTDIGNKAFVPYTADYFFYKKQ